MIRLDGNNTGEKMALPRSNPATFQWNVTEKQNRNIPGRMSQLQQTLRDLANLKKQEGSGFRGMLGTTARSIGQVAERGRQQQEKQDLKDYEEERLREQRTYQEGQTADQRAYAEEQKRLEIERQEGQEADDEYKELRTNALNNLLATYKEDITPENVEEIIGLAKGIIDTIEYYPEDEVADKRFKEKLASQFENHARVFATPEAINISSEEFTNWKSIIQERALEVLAQTKDADGNPNLKYTTDEDGVEIPDLVNSNWGPYYAEIERLLADGGIVEDENLRVALRNYYNQEEQGDNKNIDLNENTDLAEFPLGGVTEEDSGASEYSPLFGETPEKWKERMAADMGLPQSGDKSRYPQNIFSSEAIRKGIDVSDTMLGRYDAGKVADDSRAIIQALTKNFRNETEIDWSDPVDIQKHQYRLRNASPEQLASFIDEQLTKVNYNSLNTFDQTRYDTVKKAVNNVRELPGPEGIGPVDPVMGFVINNKEYSIKSIMDMLEQLVNVSNGEEQKLTRTTGSS